MGKGKEKRHERGEGSKRAMEGEKGMIGRKKMRKELKEGKGEER